MRDYHPPEGPAWARAAVADWLNGVAGDGDPGRVVLTDGAQHGLACVLRALTQRGDLILADSITYQGISALCRSQGLELRGLSMDREGMRPDAFEAACAEFAPPRGFPRAEPAHVDRVVAELNARGVAAQQLPDVEAIVSSVAPQLASGDVVAILSNGGFGGIYEKLPAALQLRSR